MTKIRPIEANDFPGWLPLWDGNNLGQRDEQVTTNTWSRLIDPNSPVCGLVAEQNGELCGLIHYILHPTTGSLKDICYMQDVYVAPDSRQQGIARKLVKHLAKIGDQQDWARIYWLAESDNEPAQALYKTLGVQLNFTLHIWPLEKLF